MPSDRGRPITDLTSQIALPLLQQDVASVIAGCPMIERQVETGHGEGHYFLRVTPYKNARGVTDGAAVSFVDVTGLMQAERRLRVMVAELQHRTRNLLGVVQAIARQTIGKGGSLDAYKDRLSALGRVQGLISQAAEERVELGDIIRLELHAHGAQDGRVSVQGPPVPLPLDHVQSVALVLHELATNAVKYGALKDGAGSLDRAMAAHRRMAAARASCSSNGPSVGSRSRPGAADHQGFGRQLIQNSLTAALRAKTELVFGEDGVLCRIEMPADTLLGIGSR